MSRLRSRGKFQILCRSEPHDWGMRRTESVSQFSWALHWWMLLIRWQQSLWLVDDLTYSHVAIYREHIGYPWADHEGLGSGFEGFIVVWTVCAVLCYAVLCCASPKTMLRVKRKRILLYRCWVLGEKMVPAARKRTAIRKTSIPEFNGYRLKELHAPFIKELEVCSDETRLRVS